MSEKIWYRTDNCQIVKRLENSPDSLPDWDYEKFKFLCLALIEDGSARALFLEYYLKDNPPLMVSDPVVPFHHSLPIPDTGFLADETIILFKDDDGTEKKRLADLAKKLIEKKYLDQDKLHIIRCECGEFSVGSGVQSKQGFFCTKCRKPAFKGSKNNRITKVYTFSGELKDLLYRWRGRILEGLVYHAFKSDQRVENRFYVIAYPQIRTIVWDEKDQERIESTGERDIVLVDREEKLKPIVVLAGITASQTAERKQVMQCSNLDLPVIFICPRGMSQESSISNASTKVFDNVVSDSAFPRSLAEFVVKNFIDK